MFKRQHNCAGYSAIELVITLSVLASIIVMIITFSDFLLKPAKGYAIANSAIEYANDARDFIDGHAMALTDTLTSDGDVSNGSVVTISPQLLIADGILPANYQGYNSLKQYPCVVVTYNDHQLEAYLYYRQDTSKSLLTPRQQHAGLMHGGGMMGLYHDGAVDGAGKTWSLDQKTTSKLFIKQGSRVNAISDTDANLWQCKGSYIANDSLVVSFASLLDLPNKLPKNDVISQYNDFRENGDSSSSNNTMNTDLDMDYKSEHNAVILQMNQDCIMNPKDKDTMQDYASKTIEKGNLKLNPKGCKNRQLSIRLAKDVEGNDEMLVTGFRQGGDSAAYSGYRHGFMKDPPDRPYVGEVIARSFAPTMAIAVGTKCTTLEIGTIARQALSKNANDVNNLYLSQVICMKNPLCPMASGGICYMPINSVTITYTIPGITDNNKPEPNPRAINSANCPSGMAMVNYSDDHMNPPDWGTRCCVYGLFGSCIAAARAHDFTYDGPQNQYLPNTSGDVLPFKSGVKLGLDHYRFTCDALCSCPGHDAGLWQPQITSITCSNDINRVPVVHKAN